MAGEDLLWQDEEDVAESVELGCLFPDQCIMPGIHLKMECATVEHVQALEKELLEKPPEAPHG